MELEWLKKNLSACDVRELRALIDHDNSDLIISRQCALLGLARSTLYYQTTPGRESTLRIMAKINTDIPLRKGFLYLVAIVDLFSRNVLSCKLSNNLDLEFCLEALEMALGCGRKPEVFHSDQGCQFTPSVFVARSLLRVDHRTQNRGVFAAEEIQSGIELRKT